MAQVKADFQLVCNSRTDHLLQSLSLGVASPVCKERMPFLVMLNHTSRSMFGMHPRSVSDTFKRSQQGHNELAACPG